MGLGVAVGLVVATFTASFVEFVEVLTIVLNANDVPLAAAAAGAAGLVVVGAGTLARRPLARIPENTLKYVVGLLLATFGTFWSVEGLGVFRPGPESLQWPGHDLMIPVLLAAWFLV